MFNSRFSQRTNSGQTRQNKTGKFIANQVLVLAQLDSGVLFLDGRLPRPYASVAVLAPNGSRYVIRGYDRVAASIKAAIPGQTAEYGGRHVNAGVRNGTFKGSFVLAKSWKLVKSEIDPYFTELQTLQAEHDRTVVAIAGTTEL